MAKIMKIAERYGAVKCGMKKLFVNFVCFESVQLNEFLNRLIGRNIFLLVEKDAIDFFSLSSGRDGLEYFA